MRDSVVAKPNLRNAFMRELLAKRRWMHDNFPESESILAIDILVNVTSSTLNNTPTAMKDLLGSLPFSEVGIRKQIQRLKKNGWVRIDRSPQDQRIRVLVAEDKLLELFAKYEEECLKLCPPPLGRISCLFCY